MGPSTQFAKRQRSSYARSSGRHTELSLRATAGTLRYQDDCSFNHASPLFLRFLLQRGQNIMLSRLISILRLHSNMFRAYSCNSHDDNHDSAYQEQVHGSRYVTSSGWPRCACHSPRAFPGRKEIVMFFYMYAIIELLAFFLDSGIIPSAHVSYPVRDP